MQGVVELLAHLRSLGVRLSVENGQLNCNAPKGVLTKELQASIRENKFHIIALLSENAQNPPASKASPLTKSEQSELLARWNDTKVEYPANVLLHELFERQVVRTPQAVAVEFEGSSFTYAELNARANQLAHSLRAQAVGPDTLVGVFMERSLEMLVALYGIVKAGGAYVPIDPEYPADRVAFMLEDAHAPLLLSQSHLTDRLPKQDYAVVCLDTEWSAIADANASNPARTISPSNLAYVIYTSGSTGRPNGVMIEHRSVVNYLCWAIQTYSVSAGDSVPVDTSIAFDLTITSLFPPLLVGGSIELLPRAGGAQSLLQALRTEKNRGLVKITPAHLEMLNWQAHPEDMARMTKTLVVGGETLLAERISKWRDFAPETRLFNEYGPTEATVGCTAYEVRVEDPRTGPILIGRPIANTQVYILDGDLEPVPVGVAGELYIGGEGLARGYLNRPELTAKKFVANPFAVGKRMYRTGDLARYRADGNIECLGRTDHQVKIRGFRVELGEIEAMLSRHPSVKYCLVMAREDAPGEKRLVAYLVCAEGEAPSDDSLREYLKAELPEYMVPSAFVGLKAMPVTSNGKVDRRALPAPGITESKSAHFAPPRTETETKVAQIWQEILKQKQVGVDDNFFDLGGHSILVVQLQLQLRKQFELKISLVELFQRPTVSAIAAFLDDAIAKQQLTEPVGATSRGEV